jgi:hypothetical protein
MTTRSASLLLAGITTVVFLSPQVQAQGGCGDPMRNNGIPSQRGLGGISLAADAAGNVFIAEIGTTAVRRIASDGAMTNLTNAANPVTALAADSAGNLFVAETIAPRVRKISSAGVVSIVAGNGVLGFTGDGGPATSASLCGPLGIAVDLSGNLFISSGTGRFADGFVQGDYRIRRVAPDGTITSFAGRGLPPRGLDPPAPDGSSAVDGGIYPTLVAAEGAGNLFFFDRSAVRKVVPAGTITTAVAGAGAVLGMAIDRTGNIYTIQRNALFKVASGVATRIAPMEPINVIINRGGSSALTVDGRGNLFFAEADKRIRKVTPDGVISTVGQLP